MLSYFIKYNLLFNELLLHNIVKVEHFYMGQLGHYHVGLTTFVNLLTNTTYPVNILLYNQLLSILNYNFLI